MFSTGSRGAVNPMPISLSLDDVIVVVVREGAMEWDIRRDGRAWSGGEGFQRYSLTPERFELIDGRLFWSDDDRVNLLAMLLENVGADQAVRLGDPRVWIEAVEGLRVDSEIDGAGPDPDLPAGAEDLSAEARACAGLLGRFMSDLSEEYWAAGWLHDLEFILWRAVQEDAGRFDAASVARLRYLSSKCGGWVVWHESPQYRRWVSLAEWEGRYAEWRGRQHEDDEQV
jgi:hypothetical protein